MAKDEKEKTLKDHEYDGIQELDNPAPFWWQLFFYLTVIFSVVYFGYYQFGSGSSSDQELAQNMAKVKELQKQHELNGPDLKKLLAIMTDSSELAKGKTVFIQKCAACHVADGGGLVGPNLTDRFWLHGKGKLVDIFTSVQKGDLDHGMPAWAPLLNEDELNNVVAYVKTLQGTQPANPKAPQGTEATPEESKD